MSSIVCMVEASDIAFDLLLCSPLNLSALVKKWSDWVNRMPVVTPPHTPPTSRQLTPPYLRLGEFERDVARRERGDREERQRRDDKRRRAMLPSER